MRNAEKAHLFLNVFPSSLGPENRFSFSQRVFFSSLFAPRSPPVGVVNAELRHLVYIINVRASHRTGLIRIVILFVKLMV